MYGRLQKCEEQLKIDKDFLADCDKFYKDRNEATRHHVDWGWSYFYKNQLDSAMMRFNQAWLLDSTNADIYWGFGNILGMRHQFKESLPFLQRSIEMNSNNPKVYESIATSYGQLFFETKDIKYLNLTIDNLKNSVRLNPNNAAVYGQLTSAYSYFNQKDSARKYLEITDRLDKNAVNPQVRNMLNNK
jgi:tetratricopeptide (TPR) repeat protein